MKNQEHKTILLVEDNRATAMVSEHMIKGFGYKVVTANSGEDSVQVATGNDIEAIYTFITPNGGKWSSKLSLGDENNPYITMGFGWGDGCGTYPYTVTAKRISAGGTGSGNYAEKSGTFVLSPPYCKQTTPSSKITLKFEKGWNLVSAPITGAVTPEEIAKKCDISTTVWRYDTSTGQYVKATPLGGGAQGYWIKAYSACEYVLDRPYTEGNLFHMNPGWNLMGSTGTTINFSDYRGGCVVTSGPWSYSPSSGQYVKSSTLEPGKGYWVKVASECTLRNLLLEAPQVTVEQVRTN